MLNRLTQSATTGILSGAQNQFIRRWPACPKLAFFTPPNVFADEITKRLAIDLGVPIVSMSQMLQNVADQAGKTEEFNHRFFLRVRDMVNANDHDGIQKEKIALKLLRLTDSTQDGFILTDFPSNVAQAELLEEYKGGLNAFVHLTLPDEILVDIEEAKHRCSHCARTYYKDTIVSEEHGVRIEKFMPSDGTCDDCGSQQFESGSDPVAFEQQLTVYQKQRDELLDFYNHYGLLVDFEVRRGFDDFEKLKRSVQFNIKH